MTRIIEIPIPEELLRLVDERAQTAGLRREAYIRSALSRDVGAARSLDEILAVFRGQVSESGMDDDALNRFFDEARDESFRERGSRQFRH